MTFPTTVVPESQGFSSKRLGQVSALLERYIRNDLLKGCSVLLARRGEVVHLESAGSTGTGNKKLELDSLFRIYSMTKPVTTVAALMLFEEGKLLLDDPVARYLPAFKDTRVHAVSEPKNLKLVEQERPMTIRDLMTHTAGLSYGWFIDTPVDRLYRESKVSPAATKLQDFVAFLATMPLVFQPGSHWRYSHATDVLAHLVEVIADEDLGSFLQRRIFEPLAMKDTAFGLPKAKADRLTSVYCPSENYSFTLDYSTLEPGVPIYPVDTPENSRFIDPPFINGMAGGGGLVSTLPDYFRFAQMLANKGVFEGAELLGQKTVELMAMNHLSDKVPPLEIGGNPIPGTRFGLGVSVIEDVAASATLGSKGVYGWSGAAMTNFWVDPVEDIVGIFMTQFMPSDFYRVVREFRVAAYQALRE